MAERNLVIWDGECGFCRRCVAWIQRHDDGGRFECRPYQEVGLPLMTPELEAACEQAVHVVAPDGTTLRAGRAILFIFGELGWRTSCRILSLPPLVWLVEAVYWVVARNRYFFSRLLFRRE
jgi:predicted DCC family thiol-disulfide oxidoreductase YuxK